MQIGAVLLIYPDWSKGKTSRSWYYSPCFNSFHPVVKYVLEAFTKKDLRTSRVHFQLKLAGKLRGEKASQWTIALQSLELMVGGRGLP